MKSSLIAGAALAALLATPALAQMGMQDPLGDATVTKAEFVARSMARFDALDTNKDGKLSPDEIAAIPGRGVRMIERADDNRDGTVTREEFTASQEQFFDMMDGNGDGKLTKAERDDFRAMMMQRMRAGPGPE